MEPISPVSIWMTIKFLRTNLDNLSSLPALNDFSHYSLSHLRYSQLATNFFRLNFAWEFFHEIGIDPFPYFLTSLVFILFFAFFRNRLRLWNFILAENWLRFSKILKFPFFNLPKTCEFVTTVRLNIWRRQFICSYAHIPYIVHTSRG